GINVTVGNDQIFPSVIIEVEKCRPPSQIFCVHRETRADGIVLEVICALVFVHGVGVVGEVRLENVEQTIAVEIRGSGAHTSLFASIFVVRKAGADSDLFEPLSANHHYRSLLLTQRIRSSSWDLKYEPDPKHQ